MFRGGLGISVSLGTYREQLVYFADQNQVVGFSMSYRIAGDIGGTLAQTGLMYLLDNFIYSLYQ